MERIKQALERAREERLRAQGTAPPASQSAPSGMAASTGQILYSRTRTEEVPADLLREKRIITAVDSGPFTDAYRILRTQVLQRLQENHWNVLAITSPAADEGRTLTAINLAISLAKEIEHTVLLVDADLRNPSIHTYFGLHPELGLSDYLTSDVPLEDLLIHPSGIGRIVILPGGKPLDNSSEMLNSPKMSRLVEELKSRYRTRVVLFDLPPLLTTADALAFSPYVDAALLIIEEGKTASAEIRRAVELLGNTKLIGTVLNKSQSAKSDGENSDHWSDRIIDWLRDNRIVDMVGVKLQNWSRKLGRKTPL